MLVDKLINKLMWVLDVLSSERYYEPKTWPKKLFNLFVVFFPITIPIWCIVALLHLVLIILLMVVSVVGLGVSLFFNSLRELLLVEDPEVRAHSRAEIDSDNSQTP